jgi:hypothetical protein
MRFTKRKPTKSGWYWVYSVNDQYEPAPVYISVWHAGTRHARPCYSGNSPVLRSWRYAKCHVPPRPKTPKTV